MRGQGRGWAPPPPPPPQDSGQAALSPLNSSPAYFTCAYHHCIILRLQASPGVRESSSPCGARRGTHGPPEPSATCGHFCPGPGWEFACKQPFVPLQAGGGAGRRRKRRSCSPAAVLGPGPRLNGDTELPAAQPSTRDRVMGGHLLTWQRSCACRPPEWSLCCSLSRAPLCQALCRPVVQPLMWAPDGEH